MGRRESAVKSVKQYFWPMMLATICICAIFYPLVLTMTGEAKDVIGQFPITITINLMVSLAVAVAVIPMLNAAIIKKVTPKRDGKKDITDWVQTIYDRCLDWTFIHPYLTIAIATILVNLFSSINFHHISVFSITLGFCILPRNSYLSPSLNFFFNVPFIVIIEHYILPLSVKILRERNFSLSLYTLYHIHIGIAIYPQNFFHFYLLQGKKAERRIYLRYK